MYLSIYKIKIVDVILNSSNSISTTSLTALCGIGKKFVCTVFGAKPWF